MNKELNQVIENILQQAELSIGHVPAGVSEHTSEINSGDIFIAAGAAIKYAQDALEKGASLVVCEATSLTAELAYDSRVLGVSDLQAVSRALVMRVYQKELESVKLIGVTGTNGKTSTASFASELLNNLGHRSGYIGTLGCGVIGEAVVKGRNTTPDVITLYRYIAELTRSGCEYVAMEVSSHGIALQRIYGLSFVVGVFTNLSRDHLDFHGSMQAYEDVKRSLFTDYKIASIVVNLDDAVGRKISGDWQARSDYPVCGFSQNTDNEENLRYVNHGLQDSGETLVSLHLKGQSYDLVCPLYGEFNVSNLMAAIAICYQLKIPLKDIALAVPQLSAVPGRLERIQVEKNIDVFIDYAHTPAGVQAVLGDVSLGQGECWSVIGAGGDRDAGKRPEMALIASDAGHVVITDDNVRNDSATQIITDMLSGLENKAGVVVCRDRSRAIQYAMDATSDDDSRIFILGKGDESAIDYGVTQLSQKDRDVVLSCGGENGN